MKKTVGSVELDVVDVPPGASGGSWSFYAVLRRRNSTWVITRHATHGDAQLAVDALYVDLVQPILTGDVEGDAKPEPIPLILTCPGCNARHIDEGEFATKVHHTHSCQACGLTWRPAVVPTVGVQFLPRFKTIPVQVAWAVDVAREEVAGQSDEVRQLRMERDEARRERDEAYEGYRKVVKRLAVAEAADGRLPHKGYVQVGDTRVEVAPENVLRAKFDVHGKIVDLQIFDAAGGDFVGPRGDKP